MSFSLCHRGRAAPGLEPNSPAGLNSIPRCNAVKTAKLPSVTEAEFLTQVIALARLRGWRVAHFRPARTATGWCTAVQGDGKGYPDLLLVKGKVCVVIELKTGDNQPTAEQEQWLAAFADAGIEAYLFRPADWEAIERLLEG